MFIKIMNHWTISPSRKRLKTPYPSTSAENHFSTTILKVLEIRRNFKYKKSFFFKTFEFVCLMTYVCFEKNNLTNSLLPRTGSGLEVLGCCRFRSGTFGFCSSCVTPPCPLHDLVCSGAACVAVTHCSASLLITRRRASVQ